MCKTTFFFFLEVFQMLLADERLIFYYNSWITQAIIWLQDVWNNLLGNIKALLLLYLLSYDQVLYWVTSGKLSECADHSTSELDVICEGCLHIFLIGLASRIFGWIEDLVQMYLKADGLQSLQMDAILTIYSF